VSENSYLPSSWCWTTIGALATFVRGVSYVKDEARTISITGHTLLLRANNIGDGLSFDDVYYVPDRFVSDEQLLRDGDVVIAMSSGSKSIVGKAAIAISVPRCSFGAFCGVVRPTQLVDSRYFGYYFQTKSYRQAISGASKGTGINNLKAEHVLNRPLPLPPRAEQARIASKIDELFSSIDEGERALERVRKLVERYRQSVLKAAVTGDLTREWREQHADQLESGEALLARILEARRKAWETAELAKMAMKGTRPANHEWKKKYQEPSCPDVSDLPELPIGWIWSSLGQLFKVTGGSTPSRKEASYWGGEIPWVSSGEVAFCRISETAERITEDGFSNSSVRLHPVGTVLLAMIGEGKTRGQAAILEIPACNNQNAASIGVSATPIPPEYVYNFLKFQYEKTRAIGQGGNQPALNGEIVKAMPIPLPPLKEIVAICEQLEVQMEYLSQIEASLQPQVALIAAQRQSILREAFAGRLVPQDISDEPAAVLLEHIAAARSASPKLTATKQGRHKKVNA